MLSKLSTVAFSGIQAQEIFVEVQIASGLPSFTIVGLPDKAVAESRERIKASLFQLGLSLPSKRIIVNLAPADIQKEGAHYDLPIAIGILCALEIFDSVHIQEYITLGGLSLDALLAPVAGVLPAAIFANSTNRGIICPQVNKNEAIWAGENMKILAPNDLLSLIKHFKGEEPIKSVEIPTVSEIAKISENFGDMSDIKGQSILKRVFEIAAVGRHNVLMVGPPGAGKSMIAQRIMSILPDLEPMESIELTMIYSVASKLPESGLVTTRPFRAPHHSASLISLIGGGAKAKPGEISLAHNGVLFLDELPEFSRQAIEALRQPLESGVVTIARANQHATYPADIQLISAMNPCRCGFFGTNRKECQRAPRCASEYQNKISGPLLDRFDMVIYVPQVSTEDLLPSKSNVQVETSEMIKKRVNKAVEFKKKLALNEQVKIEQLDKNVQDFLRLAINKMQLSARGCNKILKVAQTIAHLNQEKTLCVDNLKEAMNYRYSLAENI